MHLTPNERKIYNYSKSHAFVTSVLLSDYFHFNYRTALRNLDSLVEKGLLTKGKRYEDGYHYYPVVKQTNQHEAKYKIPFKGTQFTLPDLLLMLSQTTINTDAVPNDFQHYGQIVSSSIWHVAFRAAQEKEGSLKSAPNPKEIEQFLKAAKDKYKDFIKMIDLLLELPIYYEDSVDTLNLFPEIDYDVLNRREAAFQESWRDGESSTQGLKERSIKYLTYLKKKGKK